ncbi:hypothetical protein PS691_03507 [Pseudomonas fluorescens]|uniref:Uncharacterized protein n=1 Tax=Pseudomonas fluorescens TaxID=294 RepID=A0A5E7D4C6_PSEFL|nr:hypothetical protein PS691_03507 [Pseudomonas fluorescens]
MSRLERSKAQTTCAPKMNPERDAQCWFDQSGAHRSRNWRLLSEVQAGIYQARAAFGRSFDVKTPNAKTAPEGAVLFFYCV